jgi:RNA polymerase sigma-70 factor (ECF subfamily)
MTTMPSPRPEPVSGSVMTRIAQREHEALGELWDALGPIAYGLALRVTHNEHLAQDVVQEAFADIWAQADRFDPETASVRAWVTTIVHRRAVDRVRREQAERDRAERWAAAGHERDHDAVAEVVELRAEHRRVRAALAALTPLQREALDLAYHRGLTHSQVATTLDIPVGTAKTRIRDALRSLRATLEAEL